MKTARLLSAITFAVLIFGASVIYAGNPGTLNGNRMGGTLIRHQVNIYFTREISWCNTYFIQLTNKDGESISTSQRFIPGVNTYTFYEAGPVTGVRMAKLVISPRMGHYICLPEIWTAPDIKIGTFENGETYIYNLYPQNVPPDKD
jgi:hypothetical protein